MLFIIRTNRCSDSINRSLAFSFCQFVCCLLINIPKIIVINGYKPDMDKKTVRKSKLCPRLIHPLVIHKEHSNNTQHKHFKYIVN